MQPAKAMPLAYRVSGWLGFWVRLFRPTSCCSVRDTTGSIVLRALSISARAMNGWVSSQRLARPLLQAIAHYLAWPRLANVLYQAWEIGKASGRERVCQYG